MGPDGRKKAGRLVPKMDSDVVYSSFHLPLRAGDASGAFVGLAFSRSANKRATSALSASVAATPRAKGAMRARS